MMHFFKLKKIFLVNITNNKINNENIKEQSIDISLLFYKKKKLFYNKNEVFTIDTTK